MKGLVVIVSTLFCDLDGTLIMRCETLHDTIRTETVLIPGAAAFLQWVYSNGHKLIITTGRPECARETTMYDCRRLGIYYDQLIMGLSNGKRYVINDYKPDGDLRAFSINVAVNEVNYAGIIKAIEDERMDKTLHRQEVRIAREG